MKICIVIPLFFLYSLFLWGTQVAHGELSKSEMSRDEAVKLFADANEKYLQAIKLIASKKLTGSGSEAKRSDRTI